MTRTRQEMYSSICIYRQEMIWINEICSHKLNLLIYKKKGGILLSSSPCNIHARLSWRVGRGHLLYSCYTQIRVPLQPHNRLSTDWLVYMCTFLMREYHWLNTWYSVLSPCRPVEPRAVWWNGEHASEWDKEETSLQQSERKVISKRVLIGDSSGGERGQSLNVSGWPGLTFSIAYITALVAGADEKTVAGASLRWSLSFYMQYWLSALFSRNSQGTPFPTTQ